MIDLERTHATRAAADSRAERRPFAGRIGRPMMVRAQVFESEASFPRMGFWDLYDEPAAPPPVERHGSAAVVRITGPLSHHDEFWFDSYDAISGRLDRALADSPKPSAIVMVLDSPGGDAAGCFELAASMRKRCEAARVPLVAYVEGMACSAGYALLCAASRVVASPASLIGSIGVIACAADMTGALSMAGIKVRLIKSGARKADGTPYEPLSRESEDAIQAEIDGLAQLFFAHVAAARPMSGGVEAIRALEAGCLLGAAAKAAGLVDDVGTIDTALALPRVAAPVPQPAAPAAVRSARAVKRIRMSTTPRPRTEETETAEPQTAMEECDLAPLREVMGMPDQPAQEVVDAAVAKLKEDTAEPAEPADGEKAAAQRIAALEASLATVKQEAAAQSAKLAALQPVAEKQAKRDREDAIDAALAKRGMSATHRARFIKLAEDHGTPAALASIEEAGAPPSGVIAPDAPAASTGATDPTDATPSASARDAAVKAEYARIAKESPSMAPHKIQRAAMTAARVKNPALFTTAG